MSIFLFKDGLVRLCSEKYKCTNNLQDVYTHLTNYSLNKKNSEFDGSNHKLKVSDCLNGLMTHAPSKPSKPAACKHADQIWEEIESIVVKTILTV